MIDLLQIPDFLDAPTREAIVAELRASDQGAATVTSGGGAMGGRVDPHVRKAARVSVSPETRSRVREAFLARMGELERHFGTPVRDCEEPQFLRYETGDFFVAHQDGNTPLIHDHTRFRKISAVVFLSTPSEEPAPGTYGGGELVFHGPYSGPDLRVPVAPAPGTLVAFRAETTHEVVPVTHGERFTIVSWFRE